MTEQVQVVAVSVRARRLYLHDGAVCAITNLIDFEGEETDDPELARAVVAQVPSGGWVSVFLADFAVPTKH